MKDITDKMKNVNEKVKKLNKNAGYIRFYLIVFIIGFALIIHSRLDLLSWGLYGGFFLLVFGIYKLLNIND